ncbi:MAG: hypothetical protein WBQ32_08240, partial [Ignavibacteriaceae bacterium]
MKYFLMLFAVFTFFSPISKWCTIYSQEYYVAYIYDTDSSNGLSFRSFLSAANYTTSLIKISDISTTNLDDFDLIIIDSRSGYAGYWGTPQEVQIIQNTNKPIFALGTGGSSFYQQLGLSIQWLYGWTASDTM